MSNLSKNQIIRRDRVKVACSHFGFDIIHIDQGVVTGQLEGLMNEHDVTPHTLSAVLMIRVKYVEEKISAFLRNFSRYVKFFSTRDMCLGVEMSDSGSFYFNELLRGYIHNGNVLPLAPMFTTQPPYQLVCPDGFLLFDYLVFQRCVQICIRTILKRPEWKDSVSKRFRDAVNSSNDIELARLIRHWSFHAYINLYKTLFYATSGSSSRSIFMFTHNHRPCWLTRRGLVSLIRKTGIIVDGQLRMLHEHADSDFMIDPNTYFPLFPNQEVKPVNFVLYGQTYLARHELDHLRHIGAEPMNVRSRITPKIVDDYATYPSPGAHVYENDFLYCVGMNRSGIISGFIGLRIVWKFLASGDDVSVLSKMRCEFPPYCLLSPSSYLIPGEVSVAPSIHSSFAHARPHLDFLFDGRVSIVGNNTVRVIANILRTTLQKIRSSVFRSTSKGDIEVSRSIDIINAMRCTLNNSPDVKPDPEGKASMISFSDSDVEYILALLRHCGRIGRLTVLLYEDQAAIPFREFFSPVYNVVPPDTIDCIIICDLLFLREQSYFFQYQDYHSDHLLYQKFDVLWNNISRINRSILSILFALNGLRCYPSGIDKTFEVDPTQYYYFFVMVKKYLTSFLNDDNFDFTDILLKELKII